MANFFGFNYKSKEEREREYQEYVHKIFPYGEEQRQRIQDLLAELHGKDKVNQLMFHYILIKEAMLDSFDRDYESIAARIEKKRIVKLNSEQKECIRLLIYRDLDMDESLEYPTSEELKEMAANKL